MSLSVRFFPAESILPASFADDQHSNACRSHLHHWYRSEDSLLPFPTTRAGRVQMENLDTITRDSEADFATLPRLSTIDDLFAILPLTAISYLWRGDNLR